MMLQRVAPRLEEYQQYHFVSYDIGDIDPSYAMLRYVCDRYELNMEQRYWLAWLYSMAYNAATVFYIYNEFPDYENVDAGRLERWWGSQGRSRCVFTTDRAWVRSRNQFVPAFLSYRKAIGGSLLQEERYNGLRGADECETYRNCYNYFGQCFQMGRFGLFLLTEAVHVVTGFPMFPDGIDWRNAQSSRNGLCYALGHDDWLCGHDYGRKEIPEWAYTELEQEFEALLRHMRRLRPEARVDAWAVETTLCAYKKWHRGKRWPGYYIDRQSKEIAAMQRNVTEGVDWQPLLDFRLESYPDRLLLERGGGGNRVWSFEVEQEKRYAEIAGVGLR